jgi:hypothetical protein
MSIKSVATYDQKAAELFADIAAVTATDGWAHFEAQAKAYGDAKDAQETLVFARQLETIKRRMYEVKYTELKGKTFVPEGNEATETTEYLTYRIWDSYTMAKVIGNGSTDIPLVGATAKEVSVKGYRVAAGYQYTVDDLRSAQALNVPLIDTYARQVRMAFELAREDATAFGLPEVTGFGILNHPSIPVLSLPNGSWANPATSGEEILEDLNYIVTQMAVTTDEIWEGDTMLMTIAAKRLLATKRLNTGNSSNQSVLQAFLAGNPGITVDTWNKMNSAGASGGPRILFYKKDPEVLEFEVATNFEQAPVQVVAWTYTVACRCKWFGVQIQYPLAMSYTDSAGI